jgi:Uma2 family endonuclease
LWLDRLNEARLSGPSDLVVEVISDDGVARDWINKFYEYQETGIQEYWSLDLYLGYTRADCDVLDG